MPLLTTTWHVHDQFAKRHCMSSQLQKWRQKKNIGSGVFQGPQSQYQLSSVLNYIYSKESHAVSSQSLLLSLQIHACDHTVQQSGVPTIGIYKYLYEYLYLWSVVPTISKIKFYCREYSIASPECSFWNYTTLWRKAYQIRAVVPGKTSK